MTVKEPLLSSRADSTSSELSIVPDSNASHRSRTRADHAQHSSNGAFSHQPATIEENELESASNLAGSSDPLTPAEEESPGNYGQ